MRWIKKHFQRHRNRTPWEFCWKIAIEGTIASLAAAYLLALLGVDDRIIDLRIEILIIVAIGVAPILETLIFQAFPVWIARLCKARFSVQVIVATIVFIIPHAIEGIQAGVAAGLIGGFYFAFTYVHWREHSRWTAFWVTGVSHLIHNAIAISLALAFGEL